MKQNLIKVYLAGPDVFLPNAKEHGIKLKEYLSLCQMEGLFPLDNEISAETPAETAEKIRDANIQMIKSCDAVLANLSPFRGPEPDSGTVWEVGFAQALGKTVVGYCTAENTLKEKTISALGLAPNSSTDNKGLFIEDFGLTHNLMFADIVKTVSFEKAVEQLKTLTR